MNGVWARVVVPLAALLASVFPAVHATTSGHGTRAASATTSPVGYARYFFGKDGLHSAAVQAARWPLLIEQGDQAATARSVKSADPSRVHTIVYADPLYLRQTDPAGVTTTTRNSDTFAHHPEWFLLDASGNRVKAKNFHDQDYAADIGSSSYRRASIDFLLAKIKADGWDGVFLDDTNPTPSYTFATRPAKYPTDASWQRAELGYVTTVCSAIKAAGKRCYLNLGQRNTAWAQSVAKASTGPMTEFYVAMNPAVGGVPALATIENGYWLPQEQWVSWAEQHTTQQIVHASTSSTTAATYALGSYLLVTRGRGAFAANRSYTSSFESLNYPKAYTDARNLGTATSGLVADPSGVYYRTFTHGRVVVNPHDRARTFHGHRYAATTGTITLSR